MQPGVAWTSACRRRLPRDRRGRERGLCAPRRKASTCCARRSSRLAEARPGAEDALVAPAEPRAAAAHPQRGARRDPRLAARAATASSLDVPRRGPAAARRRDPRPAPRRAAPSSSWSTSATAAGEQTLVSQLVDPANRAEHRQWVPLEADLAALRAAGAWSWCWRPAASTRRHVAGARVLGHAHDHGGGRRTPRPLVIVYLVDTLRADHLPLYGYSRDTGPGALALREGRGGVRPGDRLVLLDQALRGLAAHVAAAARPRLRAVLHAARPGARHAGGADARPRLRDRRRRRELAGDGPGHALRPGLLVLRGGALAAAGRARPWTRRSSSSTRGAASRRSCTCTRWTRTRPTCRRRPSTASTSRTREPGRAAAEPSDYKVPLDRDRIVAQYDGAVAYGDQQFGRFLHGLRERGLYDSALVVFLADHGEEFLDHRRLGPRPHALRRAGARAARGQVPGPARGGAARRGPGAARSTCCRRS